MVSLAMSVKREKSMNQESKCPRCHEGRLQAWKELKDEEREVVKRLPGAQEFSATERQKQHAWCTRCWYESDQKTSLA